jgi:hypothetical protein
MASISALSNPWEPLLHPYRTRDLCPVDLCPSFFTAPLLSAEFVGAEWPSPAWRLRESPLAVSEGFRGLTGGEVSLPDSLEEGSVLPQLAAVKLMRVEDANRQSEFLSDYAYRLPQVRIVRNEDRHLKPF